MLRMIDLNADMGESFGRWVLGNDAALMPHLTSANIACGFHGGDPHQMKQTVALAIEHGVGIGAHVGLPDLLGFGRRRMKIGPDELYEYTLFQAGALRAFVDAAGGRLQHVKQHGVLFTMLQEEPDLAEAIVAATKALGDDVILLIAGPLLEEACRRAGVPYVLEGFVDLDYNDAGQLVLERVKQLRDPDEMGRRAARLATEGTLPTIEGGELRLDCSSICVHGDSPNAPQIATAIRRDLEAAGVELAPLARLA